MNFWQPLLLSFMLSFYLNKAYLGSRLKQLQPKKKSRWNQVGNINFTEQNSGFIEPALTSNRCLSFEWMIGWIREEKQIEKQFFGNWKSKRKISFAIHSWKETEGTLTLLCFSLYSLTDRVSGRFWCEKLSLGLSLNSNSVIRTFLLNLSRRTCSTSLSSPSPAPCRGELIC